MTNTSTIRRPYKFAGMASTSVALTTLLATVLLVEVLISALVPPLAAQEVNDSLRSEVQLLLERMERRLGDTTGLILPDSTVENRSGITGGEDSTLIALLGLRGYDLIRYQSESALFEPESRILTLTGGESTQAILTREGLELEADSALIFDENTGRLVSLGERAIYRPEQGDSVLTRQIVFDLNEDRGTATEAKTRMAAGAGSWHVSGDFPWVNAEMSFGNHIIFTSCDLDEEPHYHFKAGAIKMTSGGTLVAKDVTLNFGDVPVLWLPFMAQNMGSERRSGLLPVRFSVNDIVRSSSSYSRRISNLGYYWAMSDYSDAQLSLDWFSGNYISINSGAKYNWARQFLNGEATFRYFAQAEGGSEISYSTDHAWTISERMNASISANYTSSAAFVRRNSFDPREITGTIDSNAGFRRRFNFGSLSLSANRRQHLSDDRVEMTLPSANLSLNTITLFRAPEGRSRFYNNLTLSGSGSVSRDLSDRPDQDLSENQFSFNAADGERLGGRFSTTLGLGKLSVNQTLNFNRNTTLEVPGNFFDVQDPTSQLGFGTMTNQALFNEAGAETADFSSEELTWATTVSYQQNLVGSTTISPRLSISGRAIRSDTSTVGNGGLVSAPNRISFGAEIDSDVYGFYGDGRVRHKLSPRISYDYSPETSPTPLQIATFGSRAIQPRNVVSISLSQTLEAKVGGQEEGESTEEQGTDGRQLEMEADQSIPQEPTADTQEMPDDLGDLDTGIGDVAASGSGRGSERTVTWLSLATSAVTYDFEEASQLGHYTRGFADNLRINWQVSSDYLRGLTASVEHGVFDDTQIGSDARQFSFFLTNMNLSFRLSNRSSLIKWLFGADEEDLQAGAQGAAEAEQEEEQDLDDLETADLGEATIVPRSGSDRNRDSERHRPQNKKVGTWNASFSYSLVRSALADIASNQMLQGNLSFQPTEKWAVRWRTSYDITTGAFNDHMISLERELHRWEADFSFRQTAAGNWSFTLEVALSDNRDLHFDYEQRAAGADGFGPTGGR